MSAQTTTWILDLVDHLSSPMKNVVNNSNEASKGVEKVEKEVNSLHKTMGSVGNMLGAFGIGLGIYQVFDYLKKTTESAGDLLTAEAEVKAGLESTKNAAGVTFDAIEKVNNGLFHASNFSRAQLMDMQSILVTFPAITSKSYGTASQAMADMAERMHQGLKETAIQVGKALQDPVKGAMALHRVGVNLSADQMSSIKQMVASGNKLGAQQLIMTELNTEFAGSAKAAYDTKPLMGFKKTMEDVGDLIGNGIINVEKFITPTMNSIGNYIESVVIKIGDNIQPIFNAIAPIWNTISLVFQTAWNYISEFLSEVGGVIDFLTGTKTTGDGVVDTMRTIGSVLEYISYPIKALGDMLVFLIDKFGWVAIGYGVITAAQWLWNVAMDANPIGLIIGGVALLVGTIMYAWDKFGVFRGGIMATWETLKGFGNIINEYVIDRVEGLISGLGGIAKAIGQLFHKDFKGAWETAKQAGMDLTGITAGQKAIENAKNAGKSIGSAYQQGVSEVAANDKKKAEADKTKKKDTDLSKGGISPIIKPTGLGSSGSGKGGLSGSGGGVGGVKTINQKIEIKNYFSVSGGGDVEGIAEKVVRAINDRLRDATVVLE